MTAQPEPRNRSQIRRPRLRLVSSRPAPQKLDARLRPGRPAPRPAADDEVRDRARWLERVRDVLAVDPQSGPAIERLIEVLTGPAAIRLPSRFSAAATATQAQRRAFIVGAIGLLGPLVLWPLPTLTILFAVATMLYIGAFAYRMRLFWSSLRNPAVVRVSDANARAIPDAELPTYTILIPAYREPEVIARLLAEIDRLEYPRNKLEVKLLLEPDDKATHEAVIQARPASYVTIVTIPDISPKTKPKACNVGLAEARGKYVAVFDAEDRPEPLQLRRVVAAYRSVGSDVACLQAKLAYYNANQNLITRWFATEYAMWFGQLLPGLVARNAPVPLGGTSNHFRRDVLIRLGGWDSYNVTEDADLGIRLHRAGYRTQVLDSETLEEANSDFINWEKQRSRWYKGYLQTWLVHMRQPRRLLRELGPSGFIGFNLFVGGTPLLALLNPLFWALTFLWFLTGSPIIAALFPAWLYYAALFCLVVGNASIFYSTIVGARLTGDPRLVLAAAAVPVYWVMMSMAAVKAVAQLLNSPSFWEKTTHGLDRQVARDIDSAAA
jgi:cellulose synthase/poly-beta-1,6-N-acetylglucosamine synthase-like glycosyltransferase